MPDSNNTGSAFFASLMSGLGSAVGGIPGALVGAGIQKLFTPSLNRQSEISKEMYDYQYDKQKPSAMVSEMSRAGLNKGLMYSGAGQSGIKATMQGVTPHQSTAQRIDPLTMTNVENVQANTAKQQAETENTKERTITEKVEQEKKKQETLLVQKEQAKTEDERRRIQQEIDESKQRVKTLQSESSLNYSKALTEELSRPYVLERYKVQNKLDNARAWREAVNAKFEQEHNITMSSNGGLNNILNTASELLFGTQKFKDWMRNVGAGDLSEANATSAIYKMLTEIFSNDKSLWELFNPLASLIYRIAKANA